jgi:type IV secretion system protein VirB10
VLLDRGSQLVGEYQGGLTQGQARIFVLWTRVKTPNGVIIPLDSPGTDALGRTGHEGFVDNHFFQRFGAAVIYSLVRDSIQLAQRRNNSNINIGGNGTDAVAVEMLRNTINIPPTLNINQGDHIQIMVARDLDFSTVYNLEAKEGLSNAGSAN